MSLISVSMTVILNLAFQCIGRELPLPQNRSRRQAGFPHASCSWSSYRQERPGYCQQDRSAGNEQDRCPFSHNTSERVYTEDYHGNIPRFFGQPIAVQRWHRTRSEPRIGSRTQIPRWWSRHQNVRYKNANVNTAKPRYFCQGLRTSVISGPYFMIADTPASVVKQKIWCTKDLSLLDCISLTNFSTNYQGVF